MSGDAEPKIGRTGVVLRDPLPWHDLVEVVEAAEDTGYEAVFVPEIAGREAFSTLAGFAGTTSRLALGTGVVTIPSRSPATTAMAATVIGDASSNVLTGTDEHDVILGRAGDDTIRALAGPDFVRSGRGAES